MSSIVCGYRYTLAAQRGNSPGGIPQVKCRHLADRSCTSDAIRRIGHALVEPPGGQVTTKTTHICASSYLKWRLLADRSCISVAPLRIVHKLILSKFVCLIVLRLSQNGVRGYVASPRG